MSRFLHLTPSGAAKEKRLAALLAGRDPRALGLLAKVEDAELAGSLALAGLAVTASDVSAARRGLAAPGPVVALLRARDAVAPDAALNADALLAWHRALGLDDAAGLRRDVLARAGGPDTAPPERIETRLAVLEEWMNGESGRQLRPAEQGALALARVLEIAPFARGNGRVARLAASHLMARAGGRRPILRAEDRERLDAAVRAAFQLQTEPLVSLLVEASDRALDVMILALGSDPTT